MRNQCGAKASRAVLARADIQLVGDTSDVAAGLALIEQRQPDVIVADVALRSPDGLTIVEQISRRWPESKILGLASFATGADVVAVLAAGASGFLLKTESAAAIVYAVQTVSTGGIFLGSCCSEAFAEAAAGPAALSATQSAVLRGLTARQRQVFELIVRGMTTREIAGHLSLSTKTVEGHRAHVIRKLGCRSNDDLVRFAATTGLLEHDLAQSPLHVGWSRGNTNDLN